MLIRISFFVQVLLLVLTLTIPASAEQAQLAGVSPDEFSLTQARGLNDNATIVNSDVAAISLEFNLSTVENNPLEVEGVNYDMMSLSGEGVTMENGKPMLPMVSRFVVVPPDAAVELSYTINSQTRHKSENQPLVSLERDVVLGSENQQIDMRGVYPPVAAEISSPIIIRGVRLVKVTTYPIQYDQRTQEYIYNEQIQTTLNFDPNGEVINPVRNPVRRHRSQSFLKVIRNLAINGDQVGRDDPDLDSDPEYIGHYLVVVREECLEYAAEFIEWRRKSGYKMDILVPRSPTSANTTKDEIQDLYDEYLDNGEDPFDMVFLIGDYSRYDNGGPGAQWVLESHTGTSYWGAQINHADYLYACLEGNDSNPDVGIGRWIAGSPTMLGLASGRTMAYEAEPDMDNPEWFDRVGVYSQHWGNNAASAWHVTINTNVRWAEEVCQRKGFQDVNFYENYEWDQQGASIGPWVRGLYNEGTNMLLGRAENYYWRTNFNGVDDNTVFPMRIVTSGHGEWSAWSQWRAYSGGGPDHLKGPVSTTCGWGGPPTAPMSAAWMEMVSGVLQKELPMGWAYSNALNALELYFPDFRFSNKNMYSACRTDLDYYGDPGIQPWIGVPRMVEVDCSNRITTETRLIEVYVNDEDNGDDLAGAQVTFYAPGDMPDFDDDDYATFDEMFMRTTVTDVDGIARFVFDDDDEFEGEDAFVTVTGRDIRPFFCEIDIRNNISMPDIDGYVLEENEGNGDDIINPSETFDLILDVINLGNRNAIENLTAVVTSSSPWIEVEENEVSFDDIPEGEVVNANEAAVLHIHASCPDGISRPKTRPVLTVEFTNDEDTWQSAIELTPSAPNFVIRRIVGGDVIPPRQRNFNIDLSNVGSLDAPEMVGTLETQGLGVSVVVENANYPDIDAGDHSLVDGELFLIAGNSIAIPGSRHNLILILTSEAGFVDTAYFSLQVDEVRENAPLGPDDYGYICFDDTDDDWDMAPDYNWIEIDPDNRDADFEGEPCDFDGVSDEDVGESQVVQMGMSTQYYGELFDRITICTNGFIAMGDQDRITNFQNWPLDRGIGGGAGMVAPFWDWLDFNNNSDIFYYYDDEESLFIVQWTNLRHHSGGNSNLNFQVIFYDHNVWVTETGDQNILFQYKNIANVRGTVEGVVREKNNTYASVGISSPSGSIGLSYTFENEYPVNCAPLANQRALFFATSPRFRSGSLFGHVTDHETGQPIVNAVVYTEHGFTAITDEDGNWRINDALAEVPFDITARYQGYNDTTHFELFLPEDEEIEVNFDLLHPEFIPSADFLRAELNVGEAIELDFNVENTGNGPLSWWVEERLRGDANAEPWELRRQYEVSAETNDPRLHGVVFAEDHFYVAGYNDGNCQMYVLDRDGSMIDQYDQLNTSRYGYKDMAYDGEWIWASGEEDVIAFDLNGEEMARWEGPWTPNNMLAWDTDNDWLWVASTTSNFVAYDREGNEQARLDRHGFRMYGISYWPDDPDGYTIYIMHRLNDVGDQIIHKMNPATNDTMLVAMLEPPEGGSPGGTFIANTFDVYSWVLMHCVNDGAEDRIDIWQVDARRDWFNLEPMTGTLQTGETQDFTLTLDADNLPAVRFEADLEFFHNAEIGNWTLPITLDVVGGMRNLVMPLSEGWNFNSINVVPENLDVREIVRPLVEAGQLVILKNGAGQFYMPDQDFINIDGWNVAEGYQIYVNADTELRINGAVIPADLPIALDEGWNMISYYPIQPVDAIVAMENIADVLDIVKNGLGQFYMPEFGFSNIGDMIEAQGYQVKVSEAVDLVYNVPMLDQLAAERPQSPRVLPSHFAVSAGSDAFMPMLVMANRSLAGCEISAVNSAGRVLGAGVVDNDGRCGFSIWGDNSATAQIDGAEDGDAFTFILWNGTEEMPVKLEMLHGQAVWNADGYAAGKLYGDGATPVVFGIHDSYPNPTNGPVRLSFGLENDGLVSLSAYDLTGRQVGVLLNQQVRAGYHQVTWNTDKVPSGVYLLRLNAASLSAISKVAVVK